MNGGDPLETWAKQKAAHPAPGELVDIGRQQTIADEGQHVRVVTVQKEADHTRRLAVDHLVLLEPVDADPVLVVEAEIARGHDVGVPPHAVLRVVREEVAAVRVRDLDLEQLGAEALARLLPEPLQFTFFTAS